MANRQKAEKKDKVVLNKDGTPRKRMGRPPKPKPAPPKRGIGRPHKLNDTDEKTIETLAGLARIQCTTKEASSVMHVEEKTFIEFLQRSKKARDVWDHGKEEGKSSLRRAQLKAALNGNSTMLVWMGKQLLGQKDRHEHGGDPEAPIRIEVSWQA